jgi:hypothetical protein
MAVCAVVPKEPALLAFGTGLAYDVSMLWDASVRLTPGRLPPPLTMTASLAAMDVAPVCVVVVGRWGQGHGLVAGSGGAGSAAPSHCTPRHARHTAGLTTAAAASNQPRPLTLECLCRRHAAHGHRWHHRRARLEIGRGAWRVDGRARARLDHLLAVGWVGERRVVLHGGGDHCKRDAGAGLDLVTEEGGKLGVGARFGGLWRHRTPHGALCGVGSGCGGKGWRVGLVGAGISKDAAAAWCQLSVESQGPLTGKPLTAAATQTARARVLLASLSPWLPQRSVPATAPVCRLGRLHPPSRGRCPGAGGPR